MIIEILNRQKQFPVPRTQIVQLKGIAQRVLRHEGVSNAVLSIVFVTDSQIRALNRKFLHRTYATDVLAFDLRQRAALRPSTTRKIDGEIIISASAACRNAKIFRTSLEHEMTLYVIHGILHLLGYDDHRAADIQRMRRKENELIKEIHDLLKK